MSAKPVPKPRPGRLSADEYDSLFQKFESNISRLDCGRFCAPLNNGQPVCCTTEAAVPIMDKAEWALLSARTDIWSRFKPKDAAGRELVKEIHADCRAAQCKGAAFCERKNRSLSCRAFPFAPYIDSKREFVGIAYYWGFADRCWVISNLNIATPQYLREFFLAYDTLFERDRDEWQANFDNSATMRRVFSRKRTPFAMVNRNLEWMRVLPHGGGMRRITDPARDLPRAAPYRTPAEYRRAVSEAGGVVSEELVNTAFAERPQAAPRAKRVRRTT